MLTEDNLNTQFYQIFNLGGLDSRLIRAALLIFSSTKFEHSGLGEAKFRQTNTTGIIFRFFRSNSLDEILAIHVAFLL